MAKPIVLIIDDVRATRHGLAELLQLLGYEALEAANGADGLKCLRDNPDVAVVVLDLIMPPPDGFWFRKQQMKDPAIADIPVIVLTASEAGDVVTKALSVAEVFHKPASAEALCDAVRRSCQRKA